MKILRPQPAPHPLAVIGLLLAGQACLVVLGNAWLQVDIVHVGLLLAGGVLLSAAVGYHVRIAVARDSIDAAPWRPAGQQWGDAFCSSRYP